MQLDNLFSNETFWTYRQVDVYSVEKDKVPLRDKLYNMKLYFKSEDGIVDKVKMTKYYNESIIGPHFEFSYIELYSIDDEVYYVFRKQEDLDDYIMCCRHFKRTFPPQTIPELFEKYEECSQTERDEFFYTDIEIEDLEDNIIKSDMLPVFIWTESQIMRAILGEGIENIFAVTFSTQKEYKEGKLAQMKKNRIYSEKLSLTNVADKIIPIKETDTETDIKKKIDYWKRIVDWLSKDIKVNKLNGDSQVANLLKDCYMRSIKAGEQKITEMTDKSILQASKQAEMNVEYALKWLPKKYQVIARAEDGIVLKCTEVSDEKQEIDHIVLSEHGVFLIETKNYSGTIKIDEQGNWVRTKIDGKVVGERNPVQQVERHHLLLEHILDITDIYDIICIANDKSIIEGVENSPIPILKVDMLVHYMKNFKNKSGKVFDSTDIEEWTKKIGQYRV